MPARYGPMSRLPNSDSRKRCSLTTTADQRQLDNWSATNMTDEELRHHLEIPSFRVVWARYRLIYLQHLSKHATEFHRQLLLEEYGQGRGWLCEVATDLQWLSEIVELPFAVPTTRPDWWHCGQLYRGSTHGRAWSNEHVANTSHKIVLHEMLNTTTMWSWLNWTPLDFRPGKGHHLKQREHHNSVSDATSVTWPLHRLMHGAPMPIQVHGTLSDERPYVQSTVCPWLLEGPSHYMASPTAPEVPPEWMLGSHPWSSRTSRALHYQITQAPPACPTPTCCETSPWAYSTYQHSTAASPSTSAYHCTSTCRQGWICLVAPRMWPGPCPQSIYRLGRGPGYVACICFTDFRRLPETFMFAQIFQLDVPDLLGGRLFCSLDWEAILWWVAERSWAWPHRHPGDCLHADAEDIPAWTKRCEMKELTNLWMNLPPDEPEIPPEHPPQTSRPRHRSMISHDPLRRWDNMKDYVAKWKLLGAPGRHIPSARGPYYIVAPQFRSSKTGWLPCCCRRDAKSISSTWTSVCFLLTRQSTRPWMCTMRSCGSFCWHCTWRRILGLLQGPPCETWTAARHHQQVDSEGQARRGPRPVRSAQDPWGLAMLSGKELAQVFVGNILLLKGLVLACLVTFSGGATFLEHPSMPFQEEFARIWPLGPPCLLHRPPYGPFRRVSAEQWRYGSCGVKPTMFLYSNSNLPQALNECVLPEAKRPTTHLIGQNPDGTYRTAKAKEISCSVEQGICTGHFSSHEVLAHGA